MTKPGAALLWLTLVVGAAPASAGPAGLLDPTFGAGGRFIGDFYNNSGSSRAAADAAVQPDGKIVVAGAVYAAPPSQSVVGMVRLLPDGSRDLTFAPWNAGFSISSLGMGYGQAYAVALQPDGKIVVGGSTGVPGGPDDSDVALLRKNPDGSADFSFGTSAGTVLTNVPGVDATGIRRLVLQPDGKIVVAGFASTFSPAQSDLVLARYDATGTLDPSFGSGGIVVASDLGAGAEGLVLQPDGAFVVTGGSRMARYDTTGTLDPSFGTGGVATLSITLAMALVRQPDGKLIAGGVGLERRNADGSVDGTFGTGGVVTPVLTTPLRGLALQPDGKIVSVGKILFVDHENPRMLVNRHEDDGDVDPTFGGTGTLTVDASGGNDGASAVTLQPDGKLIVVGDHPALGNFTVTRILGGTCGDGQPDGGEECDDGNLLPADGCDPNCCLADTDGDGLCDSLDPCTGTPVAATLPKLAASLPVSGFPMDKLSVTGSVVLPHPFAPPLDPVTNGVRLIAAGTSGLVYDATTREHAYTRTRRVGWKTVTTAYGTKWTWMDRTRRTAAEITSVVVQDRSNESPGLVRFTIKGKSGKYNSLANVPDVATVVLGGAVSPANQCAGLGFASCVHDSTRHRVTCK